MTDDLLIRPAEDRDTPALAGLMGELGYPISLVDMGDRLAFAASSLDDEVFVAESDGRVIGLIAVQIAEFIHRVARYGRITALAVSADCRQQGVGSALLEHVEKHLQERGVSDVHVDAGLHRKDEAHKFYEARGFTASGVRFTRKLDA